MHSNVREAEDEELEYSPGTGRLSLAWDDIDNCVMCGDRIYREGDPPCVREPPIGSTYDDFDGCRGEHVDGLSWGEALLDIVQALGRNPADMMM